MSNRGRKATVAGMKITAFAAAVAVSLTACATAPEPPHPQDAFMARLNALCGQTFEGRVVTDDPADADFRANRLVMQVRDCKRSVIKAVPKPCAGLPACAWVAVIGSCPN